MHWPVWRADVTDHSMDPALQPGDRLLAWRGLRAGRPLRLRPGQLVIAGLPSDPGFLLVKRAARLLPEGWWLVSDNSGVGAVDSRSFGPVPPGLIYARVLLRYGRAPARLVSGVSSPTDAAAPPRRPPRAPSRATCRWKRPST